MIPMWGGWWWTCKAFARELLGVRHVEQVCALIERTRRMLSETEAERARRGGL